ncbi:DUF1996 domain-containing protein [Serratia liquefaciens]|uniref:DUF1996 domain-containing protein n=1 Tax=Serratia liquefaciens TaxID=614 RepID=UPI0005CA38A9|nr:DUF1996 domain-containing protein [Serratia liquefaciens]GAK27326.1 hypothetical protein SLIQ_11630 [Serratia liquefaciens FK01]
MVRNKLACVITSSLFVPFIVGASSLIPDVTPVPVIGNSDTGIFNVVCDYSHTLADDAIVMPGQPGLSMIHDFFGNTGADAMSTTESLQQAPKTTCTSPYDSSSYWAPQLMRANGTIVEPSYIKVYYRNNNPEKQAAVPIPPGLQLLAGNHHRAVGKYDPNVWFYCRTSLDEGEHSNRPPESCPQVPGLDIGAEFSIVLTFPDCWDGQRLTTSANPKNRNAAFSENGVCPVAFPVKIPQLNMHIHYPMYDDGNLKDAMLSMNPTVDAQGVITPVWGNLYGAHADFFAAWNPRTTRYSVEECLNRKVTCDKDIVGDFERSSADGWFSAEQGTLHVDDSVIKVGGESNIGLIKFELPERLDSHTLTKADLRLYGRQVSGETGQVRLYALPNTDWDENGNQPALTQCPSAAVLDRAQMWQDTVMKTFDVTQTVQQAMKDGKREIAFCLAGSSAADAEFSSKEGKRGPILRFDFDPLAEASVVK